MKNKVNKAISPLKRKLLIVIAVLVLAILGLGAKFAYDVTHPELAFEFEQPDTGPSVVDVPVPSEQPSTLPDATVSPEPTIDPAVQLEQDADKSFMQKRVNILALGLDESTERANWGSYRTDTMILITVNFDTKQVDMISIPRDSYVKIYNKTDPMRTKINSAFGTGGGINKKGFEYAMKTVSMLLGDIDIDYYIGFNMNVVKDVVNAMGGVEYNIDTEVNMNGRTYALGMQHLDGQGVLDYSRQRHGSSDIARVDRQQRILLAIFDQMKQTNQIVNIPKIYNAVSKNMHTNLTMTQISALALFANNIGSQNIVRHTLKGEFLNIGKTSYWGILQSAKQKLVKEIFGKNIMLDPEDDVKYIKKQLEENRLLIKPQLDIAAAWINRTRLLEKEHSAQMTAEEKRQLKDALSLAEDAYAEEQKELLDTANPVIEQVYNAIAFRLGLPMYTSSSSTPLPTPTPSFDPTVVTPTIDPAGPTQSPLP